MRGPRKFWDPPGGGLIGLRGNLALLLSMPNEKKIIQSGNAGNQRIKKCIKTFRANSIKGSYRRKKEQMVQILPVHMRN